jgi:hypothetical protein
MRPPPRLRSSELRRGSPKPSAEAAQRTKKSEGRERAALVGLFKLSSARSIDPEHSLDELAGLAAAAGADPVLRVLQDRPRPDAATFLGSGKVEALALSCDELNVDAVIFDNELSPAQLRNLEKALDRKVVESDSADTRHIRASRANTRGQAPGRAGAAEVPAAATRRIEHRTVASGRWHRHQGPWRNQARN